MKTSQYYGFFYFVLALLALPSFAQSSTVNEKSYVEKVVDGVKALSPWGGSTKQKNPEVPVRKRTPKRVIEKKVIYRGPVPKPAALTKKEPLSVFIHRGCGELDQPKTFGYELKQLIKNSSRPINVHFKNDCTEVVVERDTAYVQEMGDKLPAPTEKAKMPRKKRPPFHHGWSSDVGMDFLNIEAENESTSANADILSDSGYFVSLGWRHRREGPLTGRLQYRFSLYDITDEEGDEILADDNGVLHSLSYLINYQTQKGFGFDILLAYGQEHIVESSAETSSGIQLSPEYRGRIGFGVDYQVPLGKKLKLTPLVGADYALGASSETTEVDAGLGYHFGAGLQWSVGRFQAFRLKSIYRVDTLDSDVFAQSNTGLSFLLSFEGALSGGKK